MTLKANELDSQGHQLILAAGTFEPYLCDAGTAERA